MKQAFHGILCVLLLAACDKQQDANAPEKAVRPGKATASRSTDLPRDNESDPAADPRQTLASALEIVESAPRDQALGEVAWNTLETDPEVAAKAFAALTENSPDRLRLIQHLAMRRAEQDPDAAIEWAESLGSEMEIAAAKGQIALVLAETDPERAANLLSESGIQGRELDVVTVQVLQRWAAKEPAGAGAWVAAFPAGEAREAGIRALVTAWVKSDAPSALGWMAALRDDAVRKEAALAMAETLLLQPESVREKWLAGIDPRIRSEIDAKKQRAMENVGDNVPAASR